MKADDLNMIFNDNANHIDNIDSTSNMSVIIIIIIFFYEYNMFITPEYVW